MPDKKLEITGITLDGTPIALRPLLPEDEPALQDLFAHMSREDMRLRFFTPMRELKHALAARLSHLVYSREMASSGRVDRNRARSQCGADSAGRRLLGPVSGNPWPGKGCVLAIDIGGYYDRNAMLSAYLSAHRMNECGVAEYLAEYVPLCHISAGQWRGNDGFPPPCADRGVACERPANAPPSPLPPIGRPATLGTVFSQKSLAAIRAARMKNHAFTRSARSRFGAGSR